MLFCIFLNRKLKFQETAWTCATLKFEHFAKKLKWRIFTIMQEKETGFSQKLSFRVQSIVNTLIYFNSMLRFVFSIHLLTHIINEMQKISCMMFRTLGEVLYFVFSKICSITAAGQNYGCLFAKKSGINSSTFRNGFTMSYTPRKYTTQLKIITLLSILYYLAILCFVKFETYCSVTKVTFIRKLWRCLWYELKSAELVPPASEGKRSRYETYSLSFPPY